MQLRFALVGDKRSEPKAELKGRCPVCGELVIAKCGEQRIHHWAHKSKRTCDSWWEPETEWHRAWKSYFPAEWQEFIHTDDQTGEKHIADVCTGHGLVLEFQHSAIKPEERISRERFYKHMVWIVDGMRLKRDYPRFLEAKCRFEQTNNDKNVYIVSAIDKCFPKAWVDSSVPVIFDFRKGAPSVDPEDAQRDTLWVLLPKRVENFAIVVAVPHETLAATALIQPYIFSVSAIANTCEHHIRQKQRYQQWLISQRRRRIVF